MKFPAFTDDKYLKTRLGVVYTLSGLLIFYHIAKIFSLYSGAQSGDHTMLVHVQSLIRLAIVGSLSLVVFGARSALWGMWVSITALVITQYMKLWGMGTSEKIEVAFHFSYLRGFIFPTIITWVYPLKRL